MASSMLLEEGNDMVESSSCSPRFDTYALHLGFDMSQNTTFPRPEFMGTISSCAHLSRRNVSGGSVCRGVNACLTDRERLRFLFIKVGLLF